MVPGMTHLFVKKLHGTVFERYIRHARTDKYKLMCYIDSHEKHQPSSIDDGKSGGGSALPSNSTTEALILLSATIDSIDCCLKLLYHSYLERSNMYIETMKGLFQKIPVQLPKPKIIKEKLQ